MCKKYKLDITTILDEWKSFDEKNTSYNKMKKPELVEICIEKNFKSFGTKAELISYIFNETPIENKNVVTKSITSKSKIVEKPVRKFITKDKTTVAISRNQFGNYEHSDTKFVFDAKSKKVTGIQNDDGSISVISKEDIEICRKYDFSYEIPESLDINTYTVKDVDEDVFDEEDLIDNENNEDDSDDEIEYIE